MTDFLQPDAGWFEPPTACPPRPRPAASPCSAPCPAWRG